MPVIGTSFTDWDYPNQNERTSCNCSHIPYYNGSCGLAIVPLVLDHILVITSNWNLWMHVDIHAAASSNFFSQYKIHVSHLAGLHHFICEYCDVVHYMSICFAFIHRPTRVTTFQSLYMTIFIHKCDSNIWSTRAALFFYTIFFSMSF